MIPPVVVHCAFGGFLALGSLPLVLRAVPMNRLYGIRIPKAFESEINWYAINAYGGRLLLPYGLAVVAFGILARNAAPPTTSIWTALFVVGPMLPALPILAIVSAYARRLPDSRDKNGSLIALCETGQFWHHDFQHLTPPEKVFKVIWELESEVNNGGFEQYFWNSSGDTAFAVVEALQEVGAPNAAGIVTRALAVFPKGMPRRDWEARKAQVEDLSEESKTLLDRLDQEFFGYPDDLPELLYRYVQRNARSIRRSTQWAGMAGRRV